MALSLCAPALADDALTDEAFFEYLGLFAEGGIAWADPQHLEWLAVSAPSANAPSLEDEPDDESTPEHRSEDDE